jgi:hypothetical protein
MTKVLSGRCRDTSTDLAGATGAFGGARGLDVPIIAGCLAKSLGLREARMDAMMRCLSRLTENIRLGNLIH